MVWFGSSLNETPTQVTAVRMQLNDFCLIFLLHVVSQWSASHGFANPPRKTWWTKRVLSDGFHTCGRPSERQIKYASDCGFKTLISLHTYDTHKGNLSAEGGIYLPNTAQTRTIAEQVAGMHFEVVLPAGYPNWMNIDTVNRVHDIIRRSEKPVLFYCASSYGATFLTLMHFLNVSKHQDNAPEEPLVTEDDLYTAGVHLGFDYVNNATLRRMVEQVTRSSNQLSTAYPSADVVLRRWQMKYWQMKPAYKNLFVAGQFQSNELDAIKRAGIRVIINNRKGTTIPPNGERSQEEVNLLNIKQKTGTYVGRGRQHVEQLELNRIDPYKPKSFISDTATVNYEMRNTLEFGDDIGYNETLERMAIRNRIPDVEYIHLPLGGRYKYGTEMWEAYRDKLLDAVKKGPVLLHCSSGFRSAALALLTEAYMNGYNSTWAVARGRGMGYDFTNKPPVLKMFRTVLDSGSAIDKMRKSSSANAVAPSLILMPILLWLGSLSVL